MIRKTRPAVIVTSDTAIAHLDRVQVVPLTSNTTRVYPGEARVTAGTRPSKVLATQIMTVDKSLVADRYAVLSAGDMAAVDQALRDQLAL